MRVSHGVLLRVLSSLSVLVGATAHAAALDPPDIVAYAVGDSSVTLSWKRSAPLRGNTTYTVRYCVATDDATCTPTLSGVVTRGLEGSVAGLAPDTLHRFEVHARDKGGNEAIGDVDVNGTVEPGPLPLTTCSPGSTCDGSGDGGGTGDTCGYPTFREPFLSAPIRPFVKPAWAASDANLAFEDDFDGVSGESWIVGDMYDPLSQAGNAGIDEEGERCSGCRPRGKRWSAWYDRHWELTIGGYDSANANGDASGLYRVTGLGGADGYLALGGHVEVAHDPTRPGTGEPWEHNRLYGSWLKTWARDPVSRDRESGQNVPGKDKWTAPMYLETSVNFERMTAPGFRVSMWLMPATYLDGRLATGSEAYDGNFSNGIEIDLFEYEPWTPDCKELLEFSWISSFATKGKRGATATGKAHLNAAGPSASFPSPATGWHTLGLLWESDRLQWVYDGGVVLEITDLAKIPEIEQYLIISREMVNGRITGKSTYDGSGYFLPPEGGLYGYEGASNLGDHIGRIDGDEALIDYVRIHTGP